MVERDLNKIVKLRPWMTGEGFRGWAHDDKNGNFETLHSKVLCCAVVTISDKN